MKKIILILISICLFIALTIPIFAAPGSFVDVPSSNDAPDLVPEDESTSTSDGDVGSYNAAATPSDMRSDLIGIWTFKSTLQVLFDPIQTLSTVNMVFRSYDYVYDGLRLSNIFNPDLPESTAYVDVDDMFYLQGEFAPTNVYSSGSWGDLDSPYMTIDITDVSGVSDEDLVYLYDFITHNAVKYRPPQPGFIDYVGSGLGSLLGWVGTFLSNLLVESGALYALIPLVGLGAAFTVVMFGIRIVKTFAFGF